MVEIQIAYTGELRCKAKHGPSGTELVTDAPVDNHGKGESFSPTDLLATALGTCMITVMGIFAKKKGLELDGTRVRVTKEMTPTLPRRVARLVSEIDVPNAVAVAIDEPIREELRKIAETCPVRLSLSDAIEVPLAIRWSDSANE